MDISYLKEMERQLSSFDIYVVASELQKLIVGSSINQIYQLAHNELILRLSNKKTKKKDYLFVRCGDLICLTQKPFETPLKPPVFAMTLRKYLLNGKITGVTQYEFDRIINLTVSKRDGEYRLIFEFFSEGNIILINPQGKIIVPLIPQRWAHRYIKTKEIYHPPPNQINPFTLTFEDFAEIMDKSNTDLVRTLAKYVNFGGYYAEEICKRVDINKTTKIEELDIEDFKKVFIAISDFLQLFKKKIFHPVIIKEDGKPTDIFPFWFKSMVGRDFEKVDSFVRSLQMFIDIRKSRKPEENLIIQERERLHRQLLRQQDSILNFEKKMRQRQKEGDLIYLNFHQCKELLMEITEGLQYKNKETWVDKINRKEFVEEFDPWSDKLVIMLPDINKKVWNVALDFRKSVAENAEQAYEESKSFKNKLKGAREALDQTKKKLIFIQEKDLMIKKQHEDQRKPERIFWFEKFRWFISSDGNVVLAGRDARSNEQVVKKYLKPGDRYAHADVHGAASCVVKSVDVEGNRISISDKTLRETCQFSVCFSKAWKRLGIVQAYWVLPEQVSKTPQSGEYLPKGAFIIRGKRNYCKCVLELAVGEIVIKGVKKIMSGPVDAVKKYTNTYVVLVPGSTTKHLIAGQLSKTLRVPVSKIERLLPPGDVSVLKTTGCEIG